MVTFEITGYTKQDVDRAKQMVVESQLPIHGYVGKDKLSNYAKVREKNLKKVQKESYKSECYDLAKAASVSQQAVQLVVPFAKWCKQGTLALIREAALKYKVEDKVEDKVDIDEVIAPECAALLGAWPRWAD